MFLLLMQSCSSLKHVVLQKGYQLSYDVISNHKSVRLNVLLDNVKSDWVFDYTIPQESLEGTVYMRKEALNNSNELFHNFNGTDKTLTSSTSLRLSDSSYSLLNSGKSVELSYRLGFVKNTYQYKVVERQKLKYLVGGKLRTLEVLYIEDTSDKGHALWIWDNPAAPLILRLNFGYELVLKEIQFPS